MRFSLLLLQAAYLLLPAYFANMAPVMVMRWGWLKSLAKPIDQGRKLKDGEEIFGSHKTWRGIIVAVIAGSIIALIQARLERFEFFENLSILPYTSPLLLGGLMGFGAILGDLIKSFFKRRIKIKPGRPFIPFDQLDFVLGALLVIWPFHRGTLTIGIILLALTASFILHVLTNHVAFYLGIRREKW